MNFISRIKKTDDVIVSYEKKTIGPFETNNLTSRLRNRMCHYWKKTSYLFDYDA